MTDLPDIKIKALVSFPSNALGGTGIDVAKVNGAFVIDLDYSEFAFSGTLPPNTNTLVWDPLTNVYMLVPPSAVGGITDAPSDSKLYGRKNTAWTEVVLGAGSGDVVGPASAVADRIAVFNGPTGKIIKDGGQTIASLPGSSAVTYVAQTLTAAQQTVARQNVYAAPFDAMAYSGMQINGGMEVSQENGATTLTLTNGTAKHVVDGWDAMFGSSTATFQAAQVGAGTLVNFTNALMLRCPTAMSSLGTGDFALLIHPIEGLRCAKLGWGTSAAMPITIGFWVYALLPGTAALEIRNPPSYNRTYVASITITAASTWEYKTVTIPGDTTGTWTKDNNAGIHIGFVFAAGATQCTAPGVWTAGNFVGATGMTNFLATNNNSVYITGVVVLPGVEAPSASRSPLIMRPFDQELVTCKRYYEQIVVNHRAYFSVAGWVSEITIPFIAKRATPTLPQISVGSTANLSSYLLSPISTSAASSKMIAAAAGDTYINAALYSVDARL